MAQLTLYDMLDPMGRKPRSIDAARLSKVIAELEYEVSQYEVVVAINGLIVDASVDVEISDSDFVAVQVIPRKGVVRSIALIAVTILASTVVGPAAASFLGITSKFGAAMVSAFVTAGMSTLANAVLPSPTSGQKDGSFSDRSQTYGWNTDTNDVREGDALPWLSGELTITPKRISRYIETVDDKQYLHVLYAVHDGLLTSLTDVKINGNPIENYDGVSYEVRYGTVFQDPISDFDKARYDQPIGDKLESGSDWDTYTTDGNAVTDLVINLYFPNGLCKTVNSGDSAGKVWDEQMLVYAQYSSDNVTWHDIASPIEYSSGHGDAPSWAQSPFRRTLTVSGLAPAQYSVRVKAVLPENPGDYIRNAQCWLDFIQEATGDDFRLPGTALLRIKALATDQLSGSSPVVTCRAAAGSSNPSEVCQAMMSLCKIPSSRIDSDSFDEWTQDCIDRGFTGNIYFDAATSLREALDIIGELGRARIEQFGSRYVVIMDKPDILPTQGFLFGMGNIARNSLEIEALDVTDRANVIDYTYYPDDNDNKAETRQVVSSSYGSDTTERRIQIKLPGCTSHLMAKRHAQYRLRCNRYLTLAPSWGADADALVCRVGDIVQLAHDVPRWGYSGRLVSGSVSGCVLDRVVTMVPGKNYAVKIMYSTNNQVVVIPVVYAAETASLTFVTPVEVAPELYDNYSFGEVARMSKQVRLKSITTEGIAKTRTLAGVEYVPEIHIEDSAVVPEIKVYDYGLSQLRITDYVLRSADGVSKTMLRIYWSGSDISYTVGYKAPTADGYVFTIVHDSKFEVAIEENGEYQIKVSDSHGNTISAVHTVNMIALTAAKTATVYLYQWAPMTPAHPSGSSMFDWDSMQNADYTGNDDWFVTIPSNPGTPGWNLWTAVKVVSSGLSSIMPIDWSTAVTIGSLSQNGSTGMSGIHSATPTIYQWAPTIPSGPSGSATYTWGTGLFGPAPVGWSASPKIIDTSKVSAGILAGGCNTSPHAAIFRELINGRMLGDINGSTPTSVTASDALAYAAYLGGTTTYAAYITSTLYPVLLSDPEKYAGYLKDGATAGFTLWAAKVPVIDTADNATTTFNWVSATLSAVGYVGTNGNPGDAGSQGASSRMMYARIAGNPQPVGGTISVSGDNWPSSEQSNATWGLNVSWSTTDPDPSSTNTLYQADGIYDPATGNSVWATPYISSLKVGSLSAITANTGTLNVTGTLHVNDAAVSGTSMTGSGAVFNHDGTAAIGNSTTNITFNGSTLAINGDVVGTANLEENSVTEFASATASSPWTPGYYDVTFQTVTRQTYGGPVVLFYELAGGGGIAEIKRDGVVIRKKTLEWDGYSPVGTARADGVIFDFPDAGTHTYTIFMNVTGGGGWYTFTTRTIITMEAKR